MSLRIFPCVCGHDIEDHDLDPDNGLDESCYECNCVCFAEDIAAGTLR